MMLLDHPLPLLQWGAVLGASLAAALTDAQARRIPNWLTGSLLVTGMISSAFFCGGVGLLNGLLACVLLAAPYVLLFAFAGGGAGDAKLMGAIGMWLGVLHGAVVLMCVCFAGVAMAFFYAHGRRALLFARLSGLAKGVILPVFGAGSFRTIPELLPTPSQSQKMPYGLAICAGVVIAAVGTYVWQQ